MNYKIKQLKDLRNSKYAFAMWDMAKDNFSLDDYALVYEGTLSNDDVNVALEDLFYIFNMKHPEDFKGHSLSVSDVVEVDGVNYYCDAFGWKQVDGVLQ